MKREDIVPGLEFFNTRGRRIKVLKIHNSGNRVQVDAEGWKRGPYSQDIKDMLTCFNSNYYNLIPKSLYEIY